jgi:hypothetical protein
LEFAFLESGNFHFQVIALKTGHCIDVLIKLHLDVELHFLKMVSVWNK